ncbi:MAG: hypothetical protein Q8P04_01505 [bacterium]|nr:hypothetical protein [bacterium]
MATLSRDKLKLVNQLYYKEQLSAKEIAQSLNVSLDAVYYFMRSNGLTRRSYSEFNLVRFEKKQPSFKLKTNLSIKDKELKALGTMLYWAEGFQASYADIVDFANSKPAMISLFLKFLRRICGIDESKLRIYLYCYSNQDVKGLVDYWSTLTGVPKAQFTKPYIREDFKIEKVGKMKYGLIHIRYYDKKLLELIKKWTEEYIKKYASVVP